MPRPKRIRIRRPKAPPSGPPEPKGVLGYVGLYLFHLQRYFVTGMLVWVPLIITLWVCWWVFSGVGGTVERSIRWCLTYLNDVGYRFEPLRLLTLVKYSPGIGLLTAAAIFLTTGLLARYILARRLIAAGEKVLVRIPFIRGVYRSVQQIRDVFINREGAVFQEVVLIEYPRPGVWAVAFLTSEERGVVQQTLDLELTAVFMPTTPNPTTGFLMYVPSDEVHPLDITVEDAMKIIISGGVYFPGKTGDAVAASLESQRGAGAPETGGDPKAS